MLFEVLIETSLSCETGWTFSENQPWVWAQNQARVMAECKHHAAGAEKLCRLLPCRGRWGMPLTGMSPWLHFFWASPTPGSLHGGAIAAKRRVQEEEITAFFAVWKEAKSWIQSLLASMGSENQFFVLRDVLLGLFLRYKWTKQLNSFKNSLLNKGEI